MKHDRFVIDYRVRPTRVPPGSVRVGQWAPRGFSQDHGCCPHDPFGGFRALHDEVPAKSSDFFFKSTNPANPVTRHAHMQWPIAYVPSRCRPRTKALRIRHKHDMPALDTISSFRQCATPLDTLTTRSRCSRATIHAPRSESIHFTLLLCYLRPRDRCLDYTARREHHQPSSATATNAGARCIAASSTARLARRR